MSSQHSKVGRVPNVLLVEDNEDDVLLIREGFDASHLSIDLHRTADGVECLAFLRKQQGYEEACTPDLVIIDMKMPRMDGRRLLRELAEDPELRGLPVLVLSTSSTTPEVRQMYELGCRSYIVKPDDFARFSEMLAFIADYWFNVVQLPPLRRALKTAS